MKPLPCSPSERTVTHQNPQTVKSLNPGTLNPKALTPLYSDNNRHWGYGYLCWSHIPSPPAMGRRSVLGLSMGRARCSRLVDLLFCFSEPPFRGFRVRLSRFGMDCSECVLKTASMQPISCACGVCHAIYSVADTPPGTYLLHMGASASHPELKLD